MILLIDDNPGFSRTVSRMLEKAGYEVEVAPTGEQGLGRLCDAARGGEPYELALIDYHLDDSTLDGVELAHQARERGSKTKFVLISGEFRYGKADAESTGVRLDDFEEVMGKPMLSTAMLEMVNRYTGQNKSFPIAKEIAEAAEAAGVDVQQLPPPAGDDGDGSV